jgi:multicomponent Na+:H+ antiporter subunit D
VTPAPAILLSMFLPLAGALLIAMSGRWPNVREGVTLVTATLLFLTVLSLVPTVVAGGRPEATLIEMLPGLPIRFVVEPLGMLFALVASGLWIANSIYSIGYMRGNKEAHQTRFYACFALALASTMGIAFAGNMMTLFVFYEALTLTTYPLVTHSGTPEAMRAGRTYLGILLGTSIGLQLLAILWTWQIAGTLDFTAGGILNGKVAGPMVGVLLLLYMYGIGKAALMPLHRWLPAAMVAPTPVSALLHAVAVVKAGVFTVMKVAVYIFGIDFLRDSGQSQWLLYIAAATVLIASLVALTKDNLKARLAYSTISQLAYVVLGAALATRWGVIGGSMQIAMHAMGKITLFFCAGAIYTAAHKTEISDMSGLGRVMPFTFGAFAIGAMSVIGLPPFGGLWSKWYLILGSIQADELIMVGVLVLSSLLNVAYLLSIPLIGFFGKSAGGAQTVAIKEAPLACLIAIGLTAFGCLLLFFLPGPLFSLLAPIATP